MPIRHVCGGGDELTAAQVPNLGDLGRSAMVMWREDNDLADPYAGRGRVRSWGRRPSTRSASVGSPCRRSGHRSESAPPPVSVQPDEMAGVTTRRLLVQRAVPTRVGRPARGIVRSDRRPLGARAVFMPRAAEPASARACGVAGSRSPSAGRRWPKAPTSRRAMRRRPRATPSVAITEPRGGIEGGIEWATKTSD
jgi:hypothetical protein